MAVSYASNQNGDWDTTTIWTPNGTPGDTDDVTINHTVTISGDVTIGPDSGAIAPAIVLGASGHLKWADTVTGNWTLTIKGNIDTIASGGIFECGTSSSPIPEAYTATIQFTGTTGFESTFDPGTFRVHGFPSYHMASADMQRARLITDIALGNDRQFQVDKDVGWVVDDVIWFSTGGDPEESPTGCEKVVIKTIVNASTYTADFVSNHFGDGTTGDLLIHATRNVRIIGEAAKGFVINTDGDCELAFIDVAWVYHEFAGYLSDGVYQFKMAGNKVVPLDSIKVKNCIFDKPGSTGIDSSLRVFYFNTFTWEEDWDYDHIDEVHCWDFGSVLTVGTGEGRLNLGHLSGFNMRDSGIVGNTMHLDINGYWYVGDGQTVDNQGWESGPAKIRNFKIHRTYKAIRFVDPYQFFSGVCSELVNGEVFHNNGVAAVDINVDVYGGSLLIDNVKFYSCNDEGLELNVVGQGTLLRNCSWDNCNTDSGSLSAVQIGEIGNGAIVRFENCEFGLDAVNDNANVQLLSYSINRGDVRTIFDNCIFKEPVNPITSSYDWYNDVLNWAVYCNSDLKDWRVRILFSAHSTLEFIDCAIQNSSGVDQWDTEFPNTTRLGIVIGGGEIHKTHQTNESDGYIDGTYQRKFLPFTGIIRSHMTRRVPIIIPVTSGQTVTAKLSFKKNITQVEGRRPKLHLEGCGIIDEDTMNDATATWDELEVSGAATYDGVMLLWISCYGVHDIYSTAAPPVRTQVADYNWAYPIDPGGTGLGIGTPDNLILFCDGLSVERV
jgi:hypothetical protein